MAFAVEAPVNVTVYGFADPVLKSAPSDPLGTICGVQLGPLAQFPLTAVAHIVIGTHSTANVPLTLFSVPCAVPKTSPEEFTV
jgi:hypothetical protein